MYGRIAFTALAVVTLLAAAAPAGAGQSTGTWKYWSPNMAYAAPPYWQQPHYGGHPGWRYGHRQYRDYRAPYAYSHGYPHHRGW